MKSALPLALWFAAATPLASAQIFVVDDFGGPGVDFTDIDTAIASVPPGSVLDVQDGIYAPFLLNKALTIQGEPGTRVIEGTTIRDIPFGTRAVLSGFELTTPVIQDNDGAVLLVDMLCTDVLTTMHHPVVVTVSSSADVRLHRSQVLAQSSQSLSFPTIGVHGLHLVASRVELASSTVVAGKGADGFSIAATAGGHGVLADAGSRLHVALSSVAGGDGGDLLTALPPNGADGGDGIVVMSAAEVVVAGRAADVIAGGNAGGEGLSMPGTGGSGIVVTGGALRVSGVTLEAGCLHPFTSFLCVDPFEGEEIELLSGSLEQPVPPDPSLEVLGSLTPGQLVTYRVHGQPGENAKLRLGRTPFVVPLVGSEIEQLTNPLRMFNLGPLPASGQVDVPIGISAALPVGMTLIGQAALADAGGGVQLTNSTPLTRL